MKRCAGVVAIFYFLTIVGWVVFNILYSNFRPYIPVPFKSNFGPEGASVAQGLLYDTHHFAVIGFDHGTKGLMFLISMIIPIALFSMLHKKNYQLGANLVALVSGTLSFFIMSVSFILQATLAEYSIHLFKVSHGLFQRDFAIYLFDWAIQQGGFSDSLYTIGNILLSVWLLIHSFAIRKIFDKRAIFYIGVAWAILTLITQATVFWYLIQGIDTVSFLAQAVVMIGPVWMLLVGIWLLGTKDSQTAQTP